MKRKASVRQLCLLQATLLPQHVALSFGMIGLPHCVADALG